MNLKEKIDFLQKVNVGDTLKVEYKRVIGKNQTIEGQVYSVSAHGVDIAKSGKDIFTDVDFIWDSLQIPFDKITQYEVKEKFKLD